MRAVMGAAILGMGLSIPGVASAQITLSKNICEATGPAAANTVELRLLSPSVLEFHFQRLAAGPTTVFAAGPFTTSLTRKFSLPAGTYKLTYKHPGQPAIGAYGQNIVVRPYTVTSGNCVFIDVLNKTQKLAPAAQ